MKITRKIVSLLAIALLAIIMGYVITTHKNNSSQTQNNYRFKAIIFDMDGTTIDTDHLWKTANGPILDSHAPHLSQSEKYEIAGKFHTMTIYEIWNLLQKVCSVDITMDQIIEENIKHLHVLYQTHGISFIPEFTKFHKEVVSLGLKTAIASNSQQHTVDVIVNIVPLKDYFSEHIYNADHVNKTYKPQPDVYLYAAKMIGVDPKDCIAIEDSGTGIKAAKAAGMYCIGINTGKNRQALHLADEIVDSFSEINLEKLLNLKNY